MISFSVDKTKTIGALHFLMREANARKRKPSQYELVKSVFLADRGHLNSFGRPITFDRYVAMTHGPVPSFVYDCLKPTFDWLSVSLPSAPWQSSAEGKVHRFTAQAPGLNEKALSLSDRSYLSDSIVTVMSLTFGQLRKLTHEDRAYVSAWRDEDGVYAFPMDMGLFMDEADDDVLDDLRYLSEMSA